MSKNTSFTVALTISNFAPSDETLDSSAAQRVDDATGYVKGHVYVRVERVVVEDMPIGPLDLVYVSRATRVVDSLASEEGTLRLGVLVPEGLPEGGRYRACSVATGEGGVPVEMPVLRRGPADDCVWFEVVEGSEAWEGEL
ncbi:fungal transcriptional regulatory protein [Ophiocordyceps camponoti-floridani]|uniref:Fungal transcriptional regulatory protein n=1 Tax=Ophiocordyceps camponoti-floridani TaxID=2030778 RepID=A0A8H4Q8R3_9HYPO|nr:fungal transcriptional regulatory protein [Ophiocordyceps camponoti-floridani]